MFSKLRMSLQSSKILYFVATIIHQKGIKGLREFMMLQKRPYTAVIVMLDRQKLYISYEAKLLDIDRQMV